MGLRCILRLPKSSASGIRQIHVSSSLRKRPDIFDSELKKLHYQFAAAKVDAGEYEYLREATASRLIDRINDIKKHFPVAVDLGSRTGAVIEALYEDSDAESIPGGINKLIMIEPVPEMLQSTTSTGHELSRAKPEVKLETQTLNCNLTEIGNKLGESSVDLVISNLSMHWSNDIEALFGQINRILKPDGVVLAAAFAEDTLFELRTALSIAEQEREGGISPHISPMIRSADACGLLNQAGFALTTVDTMSIEVEYKDAFSCMEHIAGMGESNAVMNRRYNMSKETFIAAAAAYESLFQSDEGYVPATFQIVYMIGWKKDESQPKPKGIGSGKKSLGILGKSYDFTRHHTKDERDKD